MSAPPPTPYPELNWVLCELVSGVQTVLGESFVGVYLQGSFAAGDFDEYSDVDFLVVTRGEVSERQLSGLQWMHARIFDLDSPWARHLDGSYISGEALRRYNPAIPPLLYLDNGSRELIRSGHDNTRVVRWVLREQGITLAGPDPGALIDPIPAGALRAEVLVTMRDWAEELFADPDRMNNRWYQPFVVLSYCRMLHTLETGRVTSKPAAARWAVGSLDGRWSGLIQRAWAERPDPSLKHGQPADPQDLQSTVEFIHYAIQAGARECGSSLLSE